MATTTTKTTPPTLAQAIQAHAAAQAEVVRLEGLVSGSVTTVTRRTVPTQIITPKGHGTVETVQQVVEHREVRQIPALERLRARRQLEDAQLVLAGAEETLEAAKDAEVGAARERLAETVVEGQRLVEREVPALLREQRALQRKWQALAARLEAVDHRAGGVPRFAPAAWPGVMGVDGAFDAFAQYIINGYHLDRDE